MRFQFVAVACVCCLLQDIQARRIKDRRLTCCCKVHDISAKELGFETLVEKQKNSIPKLSFMADPTQGLIRLKADGNNEDSWEPLAPWNDKDNGGPVEYVTAEMQPGSFSTVPNRTYTPLDENQKAI